MFRIRKTRWKIAYVVMSLVVLALNSAALSHTFTNPIFVVTTNVLSVTLFFGGVRTFRGAGEPVSPPRAWWRMTSRPRAGFVMGTLLALIAANEMFMGFTGASGSVFANALGAAVDASLSFLYFRSSVRLRRVPPKTVPLNPVQGLLRQKPLKT